MKIRIACPFCGDEVVFDSTTTLVEFDFYCSTCNQKLLVTRVMNGWLVSFSIPVLE